MIMVRGILLGAASAIAMTSPAFAADVWAGGGFKDGYAVVADWAGFYFGANAGYARNGSNLLNIEAANLYSEAALTAEGALGGLQAGYNWQRDRFVLGIEADFQGTNLTGSTAASLPASAASPGLSTSAQAKTSLDWFGTVRGRAGAAVFCQGLIYATGGFAYGQSDQTLSLTGYNAPNQKTASSASSGVATGYTVGGGFEWAFNRAWSFKSEYQYIAFSTVDPAQEFTVGNQAFSGTFQAERTYQTVRAGVNYHLGAPYEPLK
jgi:outer membrane immunogenic protein